MTDRAPAGGARAELGAPLQVGAMRLRNRFVATAHASGLVADGIPLRGDAEYWGRVAAGGASMLISGGTITSAESTPRRRNVLEAWRPEATPGLARRVLAIHEHGAAAVCQLVHLGRETLLAEGYYSPVAPAAVRSPREPTTPRQLTDADIDRIVDDHRICTANAVEAGFDGVELHAAHGYLANQFMSPAASPGVDLDGRLSVVLRFAEAMRAAAGGAAVGVRVSLEGGSEGGLSLDGLCEILPHLDRVFDWINVTAGVRNTYVRDMATVSPPVMSAITTIRALVQGPLLISQAFRDPADMTAALDHGADLIGIARPLIADPQLPAKLLAGRGDEVRPCVSCNEDCRAFDPCLLCSVNPELAPPGHDHRPASPLVLSGLGEGRPPTAAASRVAIVGAGPAGLECAYRLAQVNGGAARIAVFDERPAIGGQLAVAAAAPHRTGWRRLLDYYASALARANVELHLGTPVDAADLDDFDDVVLATGSEEVTPAVDGIDLALSASAAIAAGAEEFAGVERLVVVDDGFGWWPSVNAVELGVVAGVAEIHVVTPSMGFALSIPAESRTQLIPRLAPARVQVHGLMRLAALAPGQVELEDVSAGGRSTLPADAVVVVGERVARRLHDGGPSPILRSRVRAIGDCVVPRRVAHAIAEGRATAEQIAPASAAPSYDAGVGGPLTRPAASSGERPSSASWQPR